MADPTLPELLNSAGLSFIHAHSTAAEITWAVREWQRYASMSFVAVGPAEAAGQLYAEHLTQTALTGNAQYKGTIDGVASQAVLNTLKIWHDSSYRIPVIVSAWTVLGNGATATPLVCAINNLWLYRDTINTAYRMYVVDLSGHFDQTPPDADPTKWKRPFGTFNKYKTHPDWGGPNSLKSIGLTSTYHLLAGGNCQGTVKAPCPAPTDNDERNKQATYRVINGVARAEVDGYYEHFNGSDSSFLSVGLIQWTLGTINSTTKVLSAGELGGFVSLLAYKTTVDIDDPYTLLMKMLGIDAFDAWSTQNTAGGVYDPNARKYTTHLCQQSATDPKERILDEQNANLFRDWHMCYRFAAIAWYNPDYRHAMWDMARIRLRDVLTTPWPDNGLAGDQVPFVTAADMQTKRPAMLGEVFRSELACSLLLRWHTISPSNVVCHGRVGYAIRQVFNAACRATHSVPYETSVDAWEGLDVTNAAGQSAIEANLLKALQDAIDSSGKQILKESALKTRGAKTELTPSRLQQDRKFVPDFRGLPDQSTLQPGDTTACPKVLRK